MCADRVVWNKDSADLPISFVGFVQIISNRTVTKLKSSALVAYQVHVVLLNINEEYKKRLIQCEHRSVEFLPVEIEKCEGMRYADIGGSRESVYVYSTSQVLDAEESVQVASGTKGRERKMCTLHRLMRMVVDDLESIYTAEVYARSKSIMKLNYFLILKAYCCDIPEGTDVSKI